MAETITHEECEPRFPGEKTLCVCDQPWPCAGAIADAITRYITKVRHGHRQHVSVNFPAPGICVSRCAEAWPCATARTAAALDAVMKQHQPGRVTVLGSLCQHHESHRYFSITSTEADDIALCADCTAAVYDSCTGCGAQIPMDQCPVRAAISRELLSKEDANA